VNPSNKISPPSLLPYCSIFFASRSCVFASCHVRLFGLLHCRAVSRRSHCPAASFCHITTSCCAALSRRVLSSRHPVSLSCCLVVSLSCLVLPRRCVAPPCASCHTCFVWLVVVSLLYDSLLLPLARLVVATCDRVAHPCCIASHHHIPLRFFCCRVFFSWLSRFLP
jgi:hypothetical protein